jgi:hypothetical protein
LDRPIEVFVIERVLIVPEASRRIGHFVTHKPDAIITWSGLDLIYRRASTSPGLDCRLHPHRGAGDRKCVAVTAASYRVLAVRSVVIHVAFAGMLLAPGILVRSDVLGFGEISRARILCRVQIAARYCDPVGYASVVVATMVIRRRWERSSERIDPGARTDSALVRV